MYKFNLNDILTWNAYNSNSSINLFNWWLAKGWYGVTILYNIVYNNMWIVYINGSRSISNSSSHTKSAPFFSSNVHLICTHIFQSWFFGPQFNSYPFTAFSLSLPQKKNIYYNAFQCLNYRRKSLCENFEIKYCVIDICIHFIGLSFENTLLIDAIYVYVCVYIQRCNTSFHT